MYCFKNLSCYTITPWRCIFNDLIFSSSSCGTTGSRHIEHSSLSPIYSVGDVFTTGIPIESELPILTKKSLKRSEIICLSDVMEPTERLNFSCILAFFSYLWYPLEWTMFSWDLIYYSQVFLQHAFSRLFLANDSIHFCNMIHYASISFPYISNIIYFLFGSIV